MPSDYDDIFRENIKPSLLALCQKILGVKIVEQEPVEAQQRKTLNRNVDYASRVKTADGQEFILHIEFQSADESHMVYRMAEYGAILLRSYRIPVRQFVVYLGEEKSRMRSELRANEVISGYKLVSLRDYPWQQLVDSEIPEEIILAILANFGDQSSEEVTQAILMRLYDLKLERVAYEKHVTQLEVLSNLRNLSELVIEKSKEMPITFDITKSALYQQGKEKGLEEVALNALRQGKSDDLILEITGWAQERLEKLKERLKSEQK